MRKMDDRFSHFGDTTTIFPPIYTPRELILQHFHIDPAMACNLLDVPVFDVPVFDALMLYTSL
jgi:hypothetical protein